MKIPPIPPWAKGGWGDFHTKNKALDGRYPSLTGQPWFIAQILQKSKAKGLSTKTFLENI